MDYRITKKYQDLTNSIVSDFIKIDDINIRFVDDNEALEYVFNKILIERKKYSNVKETFMDILNVDKLYFKGKLEVEQYFSKLEVSIESLHSGLSLLDYDEKLYFDGQSEEEIALWKTFRVLDARPEIGDGKMAVFSIKEGEAPPNEPEIYFIDRETAYKTNLTFVQYYEAVLDMLGIANWQYLYTDVSFNDPLKKHLYASIKESLEALQKALPNKDYQKYFDLLEARL